MAKHFQSAGRSEIGKVRRRNEDAILVRDDAGLWVVADGLGGHTAGDHASGTIVERLGSVPRRGDVIDFVESIEDSLAAINDDLVREARARSVDLIASTVVVLVHATGFMLCGWVGDSRAYWCSGDGCTQLTHDHVYAGADGSEPPAGSGVLTRAVGAEAVLTIDWTVAAGRPGDAFVLCSDGLNKEMSDAELGAACRRHATSKAVLDDLFGIALARAARDNVSAVIVRLRDGAGVDARLDAVNRDLRALDAAHRAGSISRADYRGRRRALFGGLDPVAGSGQGGRATAWSRWWWPAWARGLFGRR